MTKRGLLLPLALLPVLASCAPLASLLTPREGGPAPRTAGPLTVGESWTVSGPVDGRTVTTTINVGDLLTVSSGTATVGSRDQAEAFERSRAGFNVATYNSDRRTLNFEWIGEGGERYICAIDTLLSLPYSGRLTRVKGSLIANGTCQATPNRP